ncbi:hypothetical protein GCM10020360_17920 [Nonlabens tegetincola]
MLLNLAAIGGLACIVLVVLSLAFHISLIMFKTGSMSPTIPAGSLAVVRTIPASEIRVGDVLTVDRPGMLPVTHRVTSVEGSGESRTITMRGDANDAEDPAPYEVTDARRVLGSVPHLARVVVWFSNPWVLGAMTLGAATLVTWAFWPREPRDREPSQPRRPKHERVAADAALTLGASVLLWGALTLAPLSTPPASAAEPVPIVGALLEAENVDSSEPVPVVTTGRFITITSIGDTKEMRAMRPGVPVPWQIGVRTTAGGANEVTVSLEANGARDLGLSLNVRECDVRWVGGGCSGNETTVGGQGVVDIDGEAQLVTVLRDGAERWFLVNATIAAPADGTVEVLMRATGEGETVTAAPGRVGALSETGATSNLAWLLGLASVALGLGAAGAAGLTAHRRRAVGT